MVELNRVDEIQRFRTYKIYGKHHLPHYGEHKLVATVHMNTGDNSLADCESLPVLFMNAQTYRDDAMRLRNEIEQKDREISRLQADADLVERMRRRMEDIEAWEDDGITSTLYDELCVLRHWLSSKPKATGEYRNDA